MADSNNNNDEPRSTDSNLPILFANGYPTSLEKMTKDQLERFIPFLIKCSRVGSDENAESDAPKWWPPTVKYQIPLVKPKKYKKNWEKVLRKVIESCYEYHKHTFLLKYSRDLCENEPANLRYVKATETTTDLYSRDPKKLLLTFRNENMLYDKKRRMTLWKKDEAPSPVPDEEEAHTFDIMLCDYCDAEFYSDEAFTEHEQKCGESKEELDAIENIVISDDEDEEEKFGDQDEFLQYFNLANKAAERIPTRNQSIVERSMSPKKKKGHRARRELIRREKELEKTIPFSSPAGIVLSQKVTLSKTDIEEALEEIEEFCAARPDTKISIRSKRSNLSGSENAVIRSMREPRHYYWPKRCLSNTSKEANFELINRTLIQKMKPCQVNVRPLTDMQLKIELERLSSMREEKMRAECVDLCSESDDSVDLELGVSLGSIEDTVQEPKPSVSMFYERRPDVASLFSSSSFFPTPTVSALNSFSYVSQQQSHTNGEESTSSQFVFQQVTVTSSPSTSNATSLKRSLEESDAGQGQSSMVKKWLKTMSSENFSIPNQVSLMNTN